MILDILALFLLQHNRFEVLFAESEMDLSHCRVFHVLFVVPSSIFFTSLTKGWPCMREMGLAGMITAFHGLARFCFQSPHLISEDHIYNFLMVILFYSYIWFPMKVKKSSNKLHRSLVCLIDIKHETHMISVPSP